LKKVQIVTPRLTRGPLGLAERFFALKSLGELEGTPRRARGDTKKFFEKNA